MKFQMRQLMLVCLMVYTGSCQLPIEIGDTMSDEYYPDSFSVAWSEMIEGKTAGKRTTIVIPFNSGAVGRSAPTNVLEISGKDTHAIPINVSLSSPLFLVQSKFPGGVVPTNGTALDATGEQSNDDLYLFPPVGNSVSWAAPVALVQWGVGGVQAEAEVDFVNGLCINLTASFIRVSIFTDDINANVIVDGGVMVLSAFAGPGMPKPNNAQRTVNVGRISVGPFGSPVLGFQGTTQNPLGPPTINMFPIPQFAKRASIVGTNQNGGIPFWADDGTLDVTLIFDRSTGGGSPTGAFRFNSSTIARVNIPNGSMYFTVQNNHNAQTVRDLSVVFDLAI